MKDSKVGLKVLGLALIAALGLMAFGAVAAQAENLTDGGKAALFEILKSGALVGGETFTGELENWTDGLKHGFLLVPTLNLSILCGNLLVEKGEFLNDKEALASIKFSECISYEFSPPKNQLTVCNIIDPASGEPGVILSSGIVLPTKHEGKSYLLFHPHTGFAFATVTFEKGKECPLTLSNPVKGLFDAELAQQDAVVHLLTSNEVIQTLLLEGVKLLYGVQPQQSSMVM